MSVEVSWFISMLSQTSRNYECERGCLLRYCMMFSLGMVGNLDTSGTKFYTR
jgi:hypothetical protein